MDTYKIGQFIAENRKKQNMTQVQLAEKLGVTGKTVSRWENGNYMPDLSLLQPLAKELNVTLNELLRGEYIDTEHILEKTEQNLKDTVDYSNRKIQKKQNIVKIVVMVCMLIMMVAGYQATRQKNIMYGLYDTAEQRRNRIFDSQQVKPGKDAVYWQDECINGSNIQICMYATDKEVGAFAIEKVNDKYMLSGRTITTRTYEVLEEYHNEQSIILFLGADFNPAREKDILIKWNATPSDKVAKFKDQIIKPIANVNGYNLWYYATDNLRDTFDITVNEKES